MSCGSLGYLARPSSQSLWGKREGEIPAQGEESPGTEGAQLGAAGGAGVRQLRDRLLGPPVGSVTKATA